MIRHILKIEYSVSLCPFENRERKKLKVYTLYEQLSSKVLYKCEYVLLGINLQKFTTKLFTKFLLSLLEKLITYREINLIHYRKEKLF